MSDVPHPHDHERSDADPRLIAALAAGVAFFLLATPYLLQWAYPRADRLGGVPRGLPVPPAPQLQVRPRMDLDRLHADERARLDSYGWADKNHTIVRLPIERAMELLAERGLPGWPSSPPAQPTQR
jgi:hypothetical protein